MADTQPQPQQPRKDAQKRPVRPELVRGNIPKEAGWYYHRCHKDDAPGERFPRMLEPLGVMFPGWEVVKGTAPEFRSADDTSDPTIATDKDTVWMKCRDEDYANIQKNETMKHNTVVKRLGTDAVEPGDALLINRLRSGPGLDSPRIFED